VIDVYLQAQPRIDALVTDYETEDRRLRTDHAGIAWIGDRPDPQTGLMGNDYARREVDHRVFLPDTHWYDADALDGVEVQVSVGVLQVAPTRQGTQGILGALAEPEIEFYEHPDGEDGVGACLRVRGEVRSNVGLSYRVTLVCDPAAVTRHGDYVDGGDISTAGALPEPGLPDLN
jgi:hypothetical protein